MPKKESKETRSLRDFRPEPGRDYRFTVASAREAVRVIRNVLGPEARVCSVRQVEGKGLVRFLSSPRLEVVARIPEAGKQAEAETSSTATVSSPAPATGHVQLSDDAAEPSGGAPRSVALSTMERAGFSRAFLAMLGQEHAGSAGCRAFTGRALREIATALIERHDRLPAPALGQRIAFIGSPGVGKTTALCKWLAAEVLMRGKKARVLLRDGHRPNTGGPLDVFCEVLGVPISRSIDETVPLEADERLYFDLPGIELHSREAAREAAEMLDREFVTGRVLVLNAAYDRSVLRECCRLGEELGYTHLAFTHLDEAGQWGKLLETVVCASVPILFLSSGQDVAGGLDEQPFSRLVRETFPTGACESPRRAETLQRESA
jgi:flagellar biosynthesis protein FlhF